MNSATEEIDTAGKVTPELLERYNDLEKRWTNLVLRQCFIYLHRFVQIHPDLKMLVIVLLKVVVNLMFDLSIMKRKF